MRSIFLGLLVGVFFITGCNRNMENVTPVDENGEFHGLCILYKNNILQEKVNFNHGKQEGEHIKYYSNGEVRFRVVYKFNKVWNIIEYNDSLGKPFSYGTFKNGTGNIITYRMDGTLKMEGNVVDGFMVGQSKIYGANGGFIMIDEEEYNIKTSMPFE